jgi:uncharacterized protein YigA (DUF484 family)
MMSELVGNLNSLLPIGVAIVGIIVWVHAKFSSITEKMHSLELHASQNYATKDDIHELRADLKGNFSRVHDRLDQMTAYKG